MSKHTPAPWKAHFEEAYYVTGPDLGRVAMMMNLKGALGLGGRRSGDESAANCRLIAAAPAMLEALEKLVKWWDSEESGPKYSHPDKRNGPNGDAEAREWFHGNVALAGETHALARAAIKAAKGE